ncbi:hypothetical protein BDR04DRAFT_1037950, partial [Suillus decipiens]
QPDILLTEMQVQLRETCGVKVSIATISRTIRKRGFTRKICHYSSVLTGVYDKVNDASVSPSMDMNFLLFFLLHL